ncbi:MAG: hypothetical protein QGG48_01960 [Desulfatiglandales bacterium]|nr:hypothetical protein [Desulfatiglandales bacterium]
MAPCIWWPNNPTRRDESFCTLDQVFISVQCGMTVNTRWVVVVIQLKQRRGADGFPGCYGRQ